MPSDNHLYQQIASRSSVRAGLALIADPYALAIVNPGGNRYLDLLLAGNITGSTAVRTLILDDFSCSMTIRTARF